MSDNNGGSGGGGFGWGFFVGGLLGLVAGAYLASGPGRDQVDQLRTQTIELTGPNSPMRARAKAAAGMARTAVSDPEHPLRRFDRHCEDGLRHIPGLLSHLQGKARIAGQITDRNRLTRLHHPAGDASR